MDATLSTEPNDCNGNEPSNRIHSRETLQSTSDTLTSRDTPSLLPLLKTDLPHALAKVAILSISTSPSFSTSSSCADKSNKDNDNAMSS